MTNTPSHHLAWLSVHTDRSLEWLEDRLVDGFDIHHVDGVHSNNDPANLVLIEAVDHMRLHGPLLRDGISAWRRNNGLRAQEARRKKRQAAEASAARVLLTLTVGDVAAYLSRAGRS